MRRFTRALAAALAIPVLFAPPAGAQAQSEFEPIARNERERVLVERIRATQAEHGVQAAELVAPLTALGLRYFEDGDGALALAATERARQIVRVNHGLYSLREVPLIEQLIRVEEARDNPAAVWALEQALLGIAERHPDDVAAVPILRGIADERMSMLEDYYGGAFPPEIVIGCYYDRPETLQRECRSGSRGDVINAIRSEAGSYYEDAIAILLRNGRRNDAALRELENRLLRSSFRFRDLRTHAVYLEGKQIFERRLAHADASEAPAIARGRALTGIADWELLFGRGLNDYEAALEIYEQARDALEQAGATDVTAGLFAPDQPVVLPTFMPNPLDSAPTPTSTGHIDAAFEIGRYGGGDAIEILDTTTNADSTAERRLVHFIKRARFRPQIRAGQFVDDAVVTVRFHLDGAD